MVSTKIEHAKVKTKPRTLKKGKADHHFQTPGRFSVKNSKNFDFQKQTDIQKFHCSLSYQLLK